MINTFFLNSLFWMALAILPSGYAVSQRINVQKIWDKAPHSAFPDLIVFRNRFYCVFREGESHVPHPNGKNGIIRILQSKNGQHWESVAILNSGIYDLRDPKISIMPNGRLMLSMGGSLYKNGKNHGTTTLVSFSGDGVHFTAPQPVSLNSEIKRNYDWIWRVTWHGNTGYAVDYHADSLSGEWNVVLLKTLDGMDYQPVKFFNIQDRPSEATVRFSGDTMNILLRRDKNGANGLFGQATPPYVQWKWHDLGIRLGGPNFVKLPNGSWCIGTRVYPIDGSGGTKTGLYRYRPGEDAQKIMELPSGGDNSYPGMVIKNKTLYVVYYSSHEQNTAIYFAKIRLNKLES